LTPTTTVTGSSTTASVSLPGTGKPTVSIGDKNYTEQFVLGSLYAVALQANGYKVNINRNIGPTEVTIQAMKSGRLGMYPEYLGTWTATVAGYRHAFRSAAQAYRAAQRYATRHGFVLLNRTPFSDTDAVGVTVGYSAQNHLRSIADLNKITKGVTFGGPPQFQQDPGGLPALKQAYGFVPSVFKTIAVGDQYQALNQDVVQAADVNTTDGQLATGNYALLSDPANVFGWGNAIPVVSAKTLAAEGPAFAQTINKVSALLTTSTMRELNLLVDVAHQDPTTVAQQFLTTHGLLAPTASP
jgi:glycine betaine/choline ABC-type transport system substrate-binding protein